MERPSHTNLQKKPELPVVLIAGLTIIVLLLNGYGLMIGISSVLPHLLYIPIILVAYFYPRRGIHFACIISLVYFCMTFLIHSPSPWNIVFNGARVIMFLLIAAVVVFLTTRLQESESLFRGVAERSSEIIMLTDSTGKATYVSPSFGKILGMDSAEISGKRAEDFIHPDDIGIVNEAVADLASGTLSVNLTVRTRRKDGVYIPIEYLGVPIVSKGAFAGFQIVGRDVTERWQVEEAQREIRRKLADIIDFLPDPTLVVDTSGTIIAWNHALTEMSGVPAADMLGKGTKATMTWIKDRPGPYLIDYVLHGDLEGLKKVYPRARFEGNVVRTMTTITRMDGKEFSIWFSATPLIDRNGVITGAIESLRDVTHQKSIEQALLESNSYLDAVINSIADPLFIKDRGFRYIKLNDRFCRFTSHTREELIGKTDFDIFRKEEADIFQKIDEEIFLTGRENENEESITDFQGNTRIISTKKSLYVNTDGDSSIVGIMRDITERKKTEYALQEALRKLNMLSSITRHDILNQLMGLRSYLALTRAREKDPALLEFLKKGDCAADAIREQLEFTQTYEDLGVQAPRWQEIAALIRSAGSQLPLKGIAVDARVPGLSVYADPLIEKVFYTLMENTLRHGGIVTTISLLAEETSAGLIVVYRDNGVGIAAEDKPRLFQKGFGKHTGLGLFLSREILSITNITITENGEPGNGARFEMTVPKGGYRFSQT